MSLGGGALGEREQEIDFYAVQAFRYVAGKYFFNLGANPESFSDFRFRRHLPAVYSVIQNTRHLINWDTYLRKFAGIRRTGWTRKERRIHELSYDDAYETDLDHLITGACLVADAYDPNKRGGVTEENCMLRTRAILMFLLHETDELVIGDITPDEDGYQMAKENAIGPAKILLREVYGAGDILLRIWDEFNEKATDLAKNIDFLDHRVTVYKGSLYDGEFPRLHSPDLAGEFGRYYTEQHQDHPDVHVLQQDANYFKIRQTLSGLDDPQTFGWIKIYRNMWVETKRFGEILEQHDPGLVIHLSNRILDRFSCILPE